MAVLFEQMLTIPQVCEILQVGYKAVNNAIKRGQLVAAKIGGQWRISPAEFQAFIKRRSTTRVK